MNNYNGCKSSIQLEQNLYLNDKKKHTKKEDTKNTIFMAGPNGSCKNIFWIKYSYIYSK